MVDTTQVRLVRETLRGDIRPVMDGAMEVTALYDQFRSVFAKGHAHRLFAKPVPAVDSEGRPVLHWLTDAEGPIVSFDSLDHDAQDTLLRDARVAIGDLFQAVRDNPDLAPADRQMVLNALEKAFEVPETGAIQMVGNQPVLTEWGFLKTSWNAPRRILRMLFEERLPPEEATATLMVQVTGSDGMTPASGLRVECGGDAAISAPAITTDDQGIACFSGLPIGRVAVVRVIDDPSGQVLATGHAATVAGTVGLSLSLPPDRTVMLTVVSAVTGTPLADLMLTVTVQAPHGGGMKIEGITDASGNLSLSGIPPAASGLEVSARFPSGTESSASITLVPTTQEYVLEVTERVVLPFWKRRGVVLALLLALLGAAVLLLWLLCLLPFGPRYCTGQGASAGALQVRVIDAVSQAPIPGATVTLDGGGGTSRTSGSDGIAVFSDQPPDGARQLSATAPGYRPGSRPWTCCGTSRLELPLEPEPAPPAARSTSLTVRVVDAQTGAPLDNAAVSFLHPIAPVAQNTGADGLTQFAGLRPDDTLSFTVRRNGYGDGNASVRCCGTDPLVIPLTRAATPPASTLSERVTERGGQIGAVNVMLAWQSDADLDLYVTCPDGKTISYNTPSACRGKLDVDANVSAIVQNPVENIFWPQGAIQTGRYKIGVNKYASRSDAGVPTKFVIEIRRAGELVRKIEKQVIQQGQMLSVDVMEISITDGELSVR